MFGEKKGEAFNLKSTVSTATHSRGSIILWGCFTASETRNLAKVEGIMIFLKSDDFKENLQQSALKLSLSHCFIFYYYNAPKHAFLLVKNYLLMIYIFRYMNQTVYLY